MDTTQLKRIADALEEILRLVKADQEKMKKAIRNSMNTTVIIPASLMVLIMKI